MPTSAPISSKLRRRALLSSVVLSGTLLITVLLALILLYRAALQNQADDMALLVESQAQLIESVAKFDAQYSDDDVRGGAFAATVAQIQAAQQQSRGFRRSGAFHLARRQADEIIYYLGPVNNESAGQLSHPPYRSKVAFADSNDTAMKRALAGEQGTWTGSDYHHHEVLAAYTYIKSLELGLVAKIDRAELREPYERAGLLMLPVIVIMTLLANFIFRRSSLLAIDNLEQQERRYRAVFDYSFEGIVLHDSEGRFIEPNKRFCEILQLSEREVIGLHPSELSPAQQADGQASDTASQHYLAVAQGGSSQHFEWQMLRKNGDIAELEVTLGGFLQDEKQHIMASVRDITAKKKAQRDIEIARAEADEQRNRLAHVSRMSTMGEMATGIAHEINQPLTAISSYANACMHMIDRDGTDLNQIHDILGKTVAQSVRAGEVVRRLRNFVKKHDAERVMQDINELVDDVINLAEVDARNHDCSLKTDLQPALPSCLIDDIQIQQVLLNLVRNALEATAAAGNQQQAVMVKSSLLATEQQIVISVSDRGCGVDKEKQEQLFTPFFSTKAQGMGIGLSVSQSIMKAHNGRLEYCRNPEGGSIFTAIIPLPQHEP